MVIKCYSILAFSILMSNLINVSGRIDYAKGLAAFLLNPYIKPPIAVGISGTWGMGKSSLMVQV